MFDCLETILELIRQLRRPVAIIAKHDRDLARQIRRAVNAVLSNTSEGRQRRGGDQLHAYRVASGEAHEATAQLRAAVAWGHIGEAALASPFALLDRVCAMLWRLMHPRR